MEIRISFEEVKVYHKELIDTLVEKIKASKSKEKHKRPEDYEWYYSFGLSAQGLQPHEMLDEVFDSEKKSSHEKIQKQLNAVIGLSLAVSVGNTRRYFTLADKPRLFVDKFSDVIAKQFKEDEQERNRISKLSPEEREKETQQMIENLEVTDSGFEAFNKEEEEEEEFEYDLDAVLEKIGKVGMEGLTAGEKKFLDSQ